MPAELRQFEDWLDLASNASEEEIVAWVNALHQKVTQQRLQGKRYRTKQQEFTRLVKSLLDPDEVERVHQLVEERMERGGQ